MGFALVCACRHSKPLPKAEPCSATAATRDGLQAMDGASSRHEGAQWRLQAEGRGGSSEGRALLDSRGRGGFPCCSSARATPVFIKKVLWNKTEEVM